MKVIDWICSPGASEKYNADKLSFSDECLLVFDGAAPLQPIPFGRFSNSTTWFVNAMDSAIWAELKGQPTTVEALERARLKVCEHFFTEVDRLDADTNEDPISCLLLIREYDHYLELINIGDCCALVKVGTSLTSFGNSAVKQLDSSLNNLMPVDDELKKRVLLNQVNQNRKKRNQIFGYDVLTPTDSLYGRCERIILDKSSSLELLCMTDGFYRAVDTLGIYDNSGLMEIVREKGVNAVLKEIRRLETKDSECKEYPRVKVHDDASAAYLTFPGS